MKLSSEEITEMIKKRLPDAKIKIEDLRGDNDHYHATIYSVNLRGCQKVQQHKLVYDAIGDHMGTTFTCTNADNKGDRKG